ncbi:hypothetical protein DENSPDRAFT_849793 [Dentipellis sp. KUC8613]|nr:hypothetical protein DENSPDRAFT_849793 [Dentipellis sp. KUC8613]
MDQASVQALENFRSPSGIADLPNELLALIFRELAVVDRPKRVLVPNKDPPTGCLLGWLHITHTCRHWRRVALETASLWSRIDVNFGHRWAHEMILRSQRVPLTIDCYVQPDVPSDRLRRDILEHISHISELNITGMTESFLNDLLPHLVEPAPMLTALSLDSSMSATGSIAPEDIFSRVSPKLRYLDLNNVCIPWTSTIFANLTELYVNIDVETFTGFPPPLAYPSMTELLDTLDKMPHLGDLWLYGMLPASRLQDSVTNSRRSVSLSELDALQLSGPLLNCSALLHHLEYPATASVKISCTCDLSLVQETDAIISIITRHTQGRPRYIAVTTYATDYEEPFVSVLTSPWLPTEGHWSKPSGEFSIDWTHPGHERDWTHTLCLLRTFFAVAKLDNIHTLEVNGRVDDENWRSIIGEACANASEIIVLLEGLAGLLSVIKAGTPIDAFPKLHTLILRKPFLSRHDDLRHDDQPVLDQLKMTLVERKARGVPIKTLDLSSYGKCDHDWVEAVKAIVPIVKYIGVNPASRWPCSQSDSIGSRI